MKCHRLNILIFLSLFVQMIANNANANDKTTFFHQEWLKCVVSIEQRVNDKDIKPIGTGFLVASINNHMLLVTAKHVISDDSGKIKEGLIYRINLKEGKSTIVEDLKIIKLGGGDWFLSKTSDAAIRFIHHNKNSDILKIPIKFFLKMESVEPGTPALILGFPMGLRSKEYATPIVRRAVVALKEKNYFIVDGFAFPGNSGGPVLYMPANQISNFIIDDYINVQMLLGIISAYIPYKDTAVSVQTKRPRITFEENSGLTVVIPTDDILKLIERNDVKELDSKLK